VSADESATECLNGHDVLVRDAGTGPVEVNARLKRGRWTGWYRIERDGHPWCPECGAEVLTEENNDQGT